MSIMKKYKIFLDENLQSAFEENGYVLLENFIPTDVLITLQNFFDSTLSDSQINTPFFTTHWSPNYSYRKKVNQFVSSILSPYFFPVFNDYKNILAYFLAKYPSTEGEVTVHRDWTIVDEEKYTGVTAWIPMCDITGYNGGFKLVKGSHLTNCGIRGSNIDTPYFSFPEHYNAGAFKEILMKTGDILLFDQRLLHSSAPNHSSKKRIAAGMVFIPSEASPVHYHRDLKTGEYFKLHLGDDFLIETFFTKNSPENITLQLIEVSKNSEKIIESALT